MGVSEPVTLPDQLRQMRQSVHPGALGRLLAEPIKQQLPVGLGH